MKYKLILAAFAIFSFTGDSLAQLPGAKAIKNSLPKVTLGAKLGANFSELHAANVTMIRQGYKPSIVGGLFLSMRKGRYGGRIEGLLNPVNYTFAYNASQDGKYKNLYLDIPLLFEYRLFHWLWAQAGPQYSDVITVTAHPNPRPATDPQTHFKSEFSAVIGLEAKLPAHLMLGARYILGVTNVNNQLVTEVPGSWKNRAAQVYVGFRFF